MSAARIVSRFGRTVLVWSPPIFRWSPMYCLLSTNQLPSSTPFHHKLFRKFEPDRYDPMHEEFDLSRHNAVFQAPDASKPPGRVAVVLKVGYVLHDRVIRPAEAGVTVAISN